MKLLLDDDRLRTIQDELDGPFKIFDRTPVENKKELVQRLMGRKQVLLSYVNKHKRDRAAGKHVIAYLEMKENEELALVQATLSHMLKE